jgi:hypothetical protein
VAFLTSIWLLGGMTSIVEEKRRRTWASARSAGSPTTASRVRRAKAALSSGCKPHPVSRGLPDCEMLCSRLTDPLCQGAGARPASAATCRRLSKCLESPSDQRTEANSGPTPWTPSNIGGGADTLVSALSSASRSASAASICSSSNSSRSSSRQTWALSGAHPVAHAGRDATAHTRMRPQRRASL